VTVIDRRGALVRRLVLSWLLAVLGLVLVAVPSQAHSQEVASDPADKSTGSVVPAAVTMTFNQNVIALGTRVEVTGPGGDVTDGAATVTDNVVYQSVSASAPAGKYTVQWRVTSGDGHPISGEFTFTAKKAASAQTSSTPAGTPSATPSASLPATVTSAPATSAADDAGGSTGDGGSSGLSGIAVIGLGAVVLVVLIALGTALRRVLRNRGPSSR
jgi:copper resistance protein C